VAPLFYVSRPELVDISLGVAGSFMRQRIVLLLCALFLVAGRGPIAIAQSGDGVALLIANAAYPNAESPLKEPVNDARALGAQLRDEGFDVTIAENLSKQAMRQSLDRFYAKVKSAPTAVIFFSGFGIQSGRQSYLIPVDAQIWNEGDVRHEGFSLDKILSDMADQGAGERIAILDASRHNPFEPNFRSAPAGLAAITAPKGAAVMMSAPSDTVMSDGSAAVFVPELIKELKVSGATVEQVFNHTRMDVSRDTKGQQVPSFSSSLADDFALQTGPHSTTASRPKVSEAEPVEKPKPQVSTPPSIAAPTSPTSQTAAPIATTKPTSPAITSTKPAAPAPAAPSTPPASSPTTSAQPDSEAEARHDYAMTEILGTKQAWDDFLAKHPTGFYANLARQQSAKFAKNVPDTAPTTPAPSTDAAPTDLPGYYRRGQHYAVNGDYNDAIKDFTEVIRRDPKHAGALNDRCWVRAIKDQLSDALKDCDQALRIAPNYADALDSRGFINLKLGMLRQAIADYDAALDRDPKRPTSLYGRGIAKTRNGNIEDGRKDIDAAKAMQASIADEFAGYGIR
jgi:Flp pilus assembly protein TadD